MAVPKPIVAALRRAATSPRHLPAWADGLLALVLWAPSAVHHPRGGMIGTVLSAVLVAPLPWRRRAPLGVFSLMWLVAAVQGLVAWATFTDCALLVAFYTVAANERRRTTLVAGAALAIGCLAASIKFNAPPAQLEHTLATFVALSAMTIAAGLIGVNVGNRRQTLSALRERAARLEQEREHEVALAKIAERARIAREMHDVVAHNLSVMVALCDGAAYHVQDSPDRAESALQQAARTGRQALAEMRQLLGVLRSGPENPELAPQPGVRQIAELVEQVRRAGLPVRYTVSGELGEAAPGLELAVYRIVQEALTNTLKHGGAGATAEVTLRYEGEIVDVEITDTGSGTPRGTGGAGLRGMSERAAVYGGTLDAGPGPAGGWQVRARLGIPAAAGAR